MGEEEDGWEVGEQGFHNLWHARTTFFFLVLAEDHGSLVRISVSPDGQWLANRKKKLGTPSFTMYNSLVSFSVSPKATARFTVGPASPRATSG